MVWLLFMDDEWLTRPIWISFTLIWLLIFFILFQTTKKLVKMSAAMMHENIWYDRRMYEAAEIMYHEKLAASLHGAEVSILLLESHQNPWKWRSVSLVLPNLELHYSGSNLGYNIQLLPLNETALKKVFRSFHRNDHINWIEMSVRPSSPSVHPISVRPLNLWFSYLLPHYWADYFETSQDDIRHGSAHSLSRWFCNFRSRDPKEVRVPHGIFSSAD